MNIIKGDRAVWKTCDRLYPNTLNGVSIMSQVTIDNQALAQIDLHDYLEAQVQQVAPVCSGCRYFTQSNNFPLVGYCQSHGEMVMRCDRACSFAV